jgi:hypothetical protein
MSDCSDKNTKSKEAPFDINNLEGLVCYCFKKSKKEIYDAVKKNCENVIIEDIKSKMKNPGCFCETANPSGKCCLGNVNSFIKAVKKS